MWRLSQLINIPEMPHTSHLQPNVSSNNTLGFLNTSYQYFGDSWQKMIIFNVIFKKMLFTGIFTNLSECGGLFCSKIPLDVVATQKSTLIEPFIK